MFENELINKGLDFALWAWEIAWSWLSSPAAWSQFALLVGAYFAAVLLTKKLTPTIENILSPKEDATSIFATARRFLVKFLPLLLPGFAFALLAIGEAVTEAIFDSGAVVAFGKRIFLLIGARILVRDIVTDPFLQTMGRFVLLPIMVLYALGLLEPTQNFLTESTLSLGNISFSAMSIVRGVIAGSILFWLGRWSNDQSSTLISGQESLRPATRELATKAVEISIFGICFLLLMNIMGINLSALAVIGGAIGVGLGFGLQKIASNFISGVILLLEGQATVGDYVELDGGEAGRIVKMAARAAILETFDGRWIVVPNEDFITTRVVNYSDSGSANRFEVDFSVSYETDINKVPAIIEAAVATHKAVLDAPYPPDCELRGFGDSGVDFAVEFWVNGFDDGPNKFTSDIRFLVWNALKDAKIEIPYPHRTIEIKGGLPK